MSDNEWKEKQTVNFIRQTHQRAMDLAEEAQVARRAGDEEKARRQFRLAFFLEAMAANAAPDGNEAEPSRSILYRSAAALALDCADDEVLDMVDGLYGKYKVARVDGKPIGFCFVLEPEKDPIARTALQTYAEATPNEQLREDLLAVLEELAGCS